jgi:Uri superfamily endonuclease
MEWKVEYLKDDNIVCSVVTGEVTSEGIIKLLGELLELSKQFGARSVTPQSELDFQAA